MKRATLAAAACAALLVAACGDPAPAPRRTLVGEGASSVAERAAGAARAPLEIPADAPLVVVLGDSLAAGLHLAADDAFPAAAQRLLAARGQPFRLVNAGVSGDTSAGGLRRVEWVLEQSRPAVLVVELGGNDGLRALPLEQLEANLRGIVQRGRASGARVLLLGMQVPPNLGPDYARGFEAVYARVASEEGARLVPNFLAGVGGEASMNLEDGLHPTPAGHERLAANLADALAAELAVLAAAPSK